MGREFRMKSVWINIHPYHETLCYFLFSNISLPCKILTKECWCCQCIFQWPKFLGTCQLRNSDPDLHESCFSINRWVFLHLSLQNAPFHHLPLQLLFWWWSVRRWELGNVLSQRKPPAHVPLHHIDQYWPLLHLLGRQGYRLHLNQGLPSSSPRCRLPEVRSTGLTPDLPMWKV